MSFQKSNTEFIKNMLLKVWFEDNEAMILLIEQTLSVFNDRIQTEILAALSDDQMDKFDQLISSDPSDSEIYEFFQNSINDFDNFMDSLYDKFEKMYISEYKNKLNNNI